jgi:hypothetical protein
MRNDVFPGEKASMRAARPLLPYSEQEKNQWNNTSISPCTPSSCAQGQFYVYEVRTGKVNGGNVLKMRYTQKFQQDTKDYSS